MLQKLNPTHKHISIEDYIDGYRKGLFTLPKWQRGQQKIWTNNYRSDLIKSLMEGVDIPKIYIGNITSKKKKFIIDGGHRTRAINAFMQNEYPLEIDDKKIYYSKTPAEKDMRNMSVMTDDEKGIINNYILSITIYERISESDSRMIFNRLQNAAPMTMPDIVNSWEAPLIDYLRDMYEKKIHGVTIFNHFKDNKALINPDDNNLLYQLLSYFSMINPLENDKDPIVNSKSCLEMGKTRGSPCFKYLQDFGSEMITEEMKELFEENMEAFIEFMNNNKAISFSADQNTYLHSMLWNEHFSETKFINFQEKLQDWKKLDKESKELFKKAQHGPATNKANEANVLDSRYNGDISKWIRSRTSGGSSLKGMNDREEIIKKHCIQNTDNDTTDEEEVQNVLDYMDDVEMVGNANEL